MWEQVSFRSFQTLQYPQVPFPYQKLVEENQQRDRSQPEYELMDELCDVFSEGRYFDVFVEYAKAAEEVPVEDEGEEGDEAGAEAGAEADTPSKD